jgi:hypothetical protein
MHYEKPELHLLASAIAAIQGTKGSGMQDSNSQDHRLQTSAAYEADE